MFRRFPNVKSIVPINIYKYSHHITSFLIVLRLHSQVPKTVTNFCMFSKTSQVPFRFLQFMLVPAGMGTIPQILFSSFHSHQFSGVPEGLGMISRSRVPHRMLAKFSQGSRIFLRFPSSLPSQYGFWFLHVSSIPKVFSLVHNMFPIVLSFMHVPGIP